MNRHLCLTIGLLDRLFHGQLGQGRAEWPPSPHRLFQALIAGNHAGIRRLDWQTNPAIAEAFRWLERQSCPVILAPHAHPPSLEGNVGFTLNVPNNDGDKEPDRQQRLASKYVRPHRLSLVGDDPFPRLHYVWEIPADVWHEAQPHAELLCQKARHLLALGWGIDQAFADGRILMSEEVAALEGEHWKFYPAHVPGNILRVPKEGTLEDLDKVYDSFLNSVRGNEYVPPLKPVAFEKRSFRRTNNQPARLFRAYQLVAVTPEDDRPVYTQTKTVIVAGMLRHLACREADRDPSHWTSTDPKIYVAGHAPDGSGASISRFSYLPLPTIGHPKADGAIRRVLVAEPPGTDGDHLAWLDLRLRRQAALINEVNKQEVALLSPLSEGDNVVKCYIGGEGGNKDWFTVTPVILPGYDDKARKTGASVRSKSEKLFLKALVHAGIEPSLIESFALRKTPFFRGSQHASAYQLGEKSKGGSTWHVALTFKEPIKGPLAIGTGRHRGLGLFAIDSDLNRFNEASSEAII